MAKQDVELKFSLIDGVSRNLGEIQKGVSGLGAQMVKLNASADLTGKAFGAIGAVAGAFGDAITGAASVEDALTRVNTITRATVEEQTALQDAVRGAVEGTRFSSEEAANALLLLAEDGLNAKDAVAQLNTVLQFAQANGQSAATAAGALGAVLDTFDAKPAVIGALADALTGVAVASGTSTKALQEGLVSVGVAADQAGLSVNQTVGYLGLLAERGKDGTAGGKALSLVLKELSDAATPAGQEIQKLGLSADDFAGIMRRLGTDGIAAETVLVALGKRPREALRLLLDQGGGDLKKLGGIIGDFTGASKAASDALNENFAGALARITNNLIQTRNELLTPILLPLADEIAVLSARLSEFAKSPEFDAIVTNFTKIATDGLRILGDEIAKVDFTDALNKVIEFSTLFAEDMAIIAKAVDITARTIGGFFDIVSITFNSLKGVTAYVAAALIEPLAVFDEGARGIWVSLKAEAADSERSVGASLDSLGRRFTGTAKSAEGLDKAFRSSGIAAKVAAGDYKTLSDALPKTSIDQTIERLGKLGLLLKETPKPADDAAGSIEGLGAAARNTAIDIERIAIGNLLRRMDELFRAGQAGSEAYKALNAQFLAAEARVNALTQANADAAKSAEDVAGSTDKATESVRNYGNAAKDASAGADEVSGSTDKATEALSSFEKQARSVSFSLGNMTEAFAKQAQAAGGAANSADGYVETWGAYIQRYELVNKAAESLLDHLNRQNAALTEEDKIRRRLIAQGFESTTLIDQLVAAELRLANAKKQTNDEAQRGVQIEDQRRGQAGGLGTQPAATAAAPAATGGRGTAASAGSRDAAGQTVNVTINGLPNDRASWRDVIAEIIVPEINRINRLSR